MLDPVPPSFIALALLVAANAVPVIVAILARDRWSYPLDGGRTLLDGQRLLGAHKTWRGLVSGTLAAAMTGSLLGLPVWVGAGFGALSLLADATSSMVKRRLRLAPGTEFPGLDQLGEALLPLLAFAGTLSLGLGDILALTATFILLDVVTAPLRHWLD